MLWYIIETLVIYHRGFISRLTQDAIRNRQEPHLQEQEEQGSVIACKKSRRVTDLCGRATYKGEAVSGYGQPWYWGRPAALFWWNPPLPRPLPRPRKFPCLRASPLILCCCWSSDCGGRMDIGDGVSRGMGICSRGEIGVGGNLMLSVDNLGVCK